MRQELSRPALVAFAAQSMLVGLYAVFRYGIFDRTAIVRLLNIWVVASSVSVIVGLAGIVLGMAGIDNQLIRAYPNLGPGVWRLIGTLGHTPNNACGFYHFGFFISLGLYFQGKMPVEISTVHSNRRRFLVSAIVIHAAALFLTMSRGLFGVLFGLIILIGGGLIYPRPKKMLLPVSIILLLLVVAYSMVFFTYTTDAYFPGRGKSVESLDTGARQRMFFSYKNTLHLRDGAAYLDGPLGMKYLPSMHYYLLKFSCHLIAENPFTGVGPGRFEDKLEGLRDSGKLGLPKTLPRLESHSTYLGTLAEGGILLFVSLTLPWLFWIGLGAWRRAKENPLGICLYASLAGYLLFMLNVDVMNFRWLWIVAAISVAWRESVDTK